MHRSAHARFRRSCPQTTSISSSAVGRHEYRLGTRQDASVNVYGFLHHIEGTSLDFDIRAAEVLPKNSDSDTVEPDTKKREDNERRYAGGWRPDHPQIRVH